MTPTCNMRAGGARRRKMHRAPSADMRTAVPAAVTSAMPSSAMAATMTSVAFGSRIATDGQSEREG